jgi:tetratricopeptide (TPR) repeat protein
MRGYRTLCHDHAPYWRLSGLLFPMTRLLYSLLAALMLTACSSVPPAASDAPAAAVAAAADDGREGPQSLADEPSTSAPTLALRAIPPDSVLPLLSAEFALRRREYEYALGIYLEQSRTLRDPGVVSHTAQLAQFMNRLDAAAEISALWVEIEPDNPDARSLAARVALQQNDPVAALPHLASIARMGEQAGFALLVRSYEELDEAGKRALLSGFEALQQEFPDDVQLMMGRAMMLEQRGEVEAALAAVRAVFAQDAEQQQAIVLEARLLQNSGAGEAAYERLRTALAAQPGNSALRLQYARLLTRDNLPAAREQFERLAEDNPADADMIYSLALISRELEDDGAARRYLGQVLRMGGERSADAHYQLGRIAEDDEEYQEALQHYGAVTSGRDFAAAQGRLGNILVRAGQVEQKNLHFARLRREYPERAEQLYAIESEVLLQNRDIPSALAVLNEGLGEVPDSVMLRYTRSTVHQRNDDLPAMEADLRAIIEQDPDNALALNALGYTLADLTDRYAEAERLIARALALQPDDPAILDSMGWVKYRLGALEEALGYLKRAYAAFPDPEVAAHLGEVLWVKGDQEAARAIWREGAERDANHAVLQATLQRFGVTLAGSEAQP